MVIQLGTAGRDMSELVLWQRLEGALVFVAAVALYNAGAVGGPWWITLILFFLPDISFAGYLFGPKFGARAYNLVHVYAFGAVCIAIGTLLALPSLIALGKLWLAHSGFDRMLGYGLKSTEGFAVTHLGRIGR